MLYPDVPAEARMPGGGDVAGGVDARHGGAQVLVDGNATLLDLEPSAQRQLRARDRADADDDQVGRQAGAIGQACGTDGSLALEGGDRPIDDRHAVGTVQLGVDRADLRAQHTLERLVGVGDEGDRVSHLRQRGGHLGADPAGADDHDRLGVGGGGAKRIGVRSSAQQVDAVEIGPIQVERSRRRSGREQQGTVGQIAPVIEVHAPGDRVELDGPTLAQELDTLALVLVRRLDECLLDRLLATKVGLR